MSFTPVLMAAVAVVILAQSALASASQPDPGQPTGGVQTQVSVQVRAPQDPVVSASTPPVQAPTRRCQWTAPVDAPVIDPFRPPAGPYGAGNRGLEYGVVAGTRVVAVADGRVGFAGPVGGRHYLVITHPSGLRSTYGPIETIEVVRGQSVDAGDPVASASVGFHLTARAGDRYIDPQPLIDGICGTARLIPSGPTAVGVKGARATLADAPDPGVSQLSGSKQPPNQDQGRPDSTVSARKSR
ncbi:MAG: M23 family metallopeptidase [Actinomycetia bacterium]|nr:M23 family metallopeptidase [Actinomycetes bacterium]MCP5033209.1 M23 family metallopeptidase [Actinomycetes bacterium]